MSSEPGNNVAATTKGAAAEKSPGTSISPSSSRSARSTEMRLPFVVSLAPAARSIRSVWSRVATLSTTVVRPSASRPASRTHDFT